MLETGSEGAYQSDSFAAAQRLYTPQPPDVASQRWKNNSRISAGSHGQGQGPRSSFGGADSDLSTAMTSERMPFAAAQIGQVRLPPPPPPWRLADQPGAGWQGPFGSVVNASHAGELEIR